MLIYLFLGGSCGDSDCLGEILIGTVQLLVVGREKEKEVTKYNMISNYSLLVVNTKIFLG